MGFFFVNLTHGLYLENGKLIFMFLELLLAMVRKEKY